MSIEEHYQGTQHPNDVLAELAAVFGPLRRYGAAMRDLMAAAEKGAPISDECLEFTVELPRALVRFGEELAEARRVVESREWRLAR